MNLILLGAPGAGKGTQAEVICEHLHIPAVSTGNMIREALKNGTEMGLRAKSYMEEGKLVPDERMSGRRVCEACGASYHLLYKKPEKEGVCKCGGTLVQRKEDHPDTDKERLKVYHEQTEPLKAYYEKQGKLSIVTGQEDEADTSRLTLEALKA